MNADKYLESLEIIDASLTLARPFLIEVAELANSPATGDESLGRIAYLLKQAQKHLRIATHNASKHLATPSTPPDVDG